MQRNRNQTERRLIDTVGHLIAAEGVINIGVNRIARESGVNKVLIYRYFGGLEGLVEAYQQRSQSWLSMPTDDLSMLQNVSVADFFSKLYPTLVLEVRQLHNNAEAQSQLRAEICTPDAEGLSQPTPVIYGPLADALANMIGGPVGRAYAALIINGLVVLSLQRATGKSKPILPGNDSWEQVEAAIQLIFQGTSRVLEDRKPVVSRRSRKAVAV
jgi:AcrR family transcriptional regulator